MENHVAIQLPEADSLPDGFVDSSAEPVTRLHQETQVTDYKEEKLIEVDSKPNLIVNVFQLCEATGQGVETLAAHVKRTLMSEGSGTSRKETSELKRKSAMHAFITEKEFLEFTLNYQKILSERDSAISMRDKLESLCRGLQHQNEMLMGVNNKLEEQRDDSLTQLKENEMLRNKLKQKEGQIVLTEQQHAHQLKQKTLELQIADLKIQQHEEKSVKEQSQMKMYAEQVSQLLATEKNLRLQLTTDGEKFQQFQDALVKSNEVFETFKQEIEKLTKSIKELKRENLFLKGKTEKSDFTLVQLVEEREHMKKQLEKTRNQKEKLESLCRSLQAERKQNPTGQTNANLVPV